MASCMLVPYWKIRSLAAISGMGNSHVWRAIPGSGYGMGMNE